jgi:TatD DNase family protein
VTTLVDTHAHLCDASFREDLSEVLKRAQRAGVAAIVAVTETREEIVATLEIAERFSDLVRPAAGLFPTILDRGEALRVEELIRKHRNRLIAIGEVGLDHWKVQDPSQREIQLEIFRRLVDLGIELELPLNVHSRSAGRQTIEVLLERGAKLVQMHAFDGRASKALPGVEAGYFFSVPPSVVRSIQKQKLVRRLPLACLLLETDSPVLGVDPKKRNEPAEVSVPLRAIAELKEISEDEAREVISDNTVRLYGDRLLRPPARQLA